MKEVVTYATASKKGGLELDQQRVEVKRTLIVEKTVGPKILTNYLDDK